jgi:hypothetical protein
VLGARITAQHATDRPGGIVGEPREPSGCSRAARGPWRRWIGSPAGVDLDLDDAAHRRQLDVPWLGRCHDDDPLPKLERQRSQARRRPPAIERDDDRALGASAADVLDDEPATRRRGGDRLPVDDGEPLRHVRAAVPPLD